MISGKQYLVEDRDEYGRTLLYTASKSGFYEVRKFLLEKDASVDEPQRDGSTPLHAAAYFGHERVIKLLLQYGARTDIVNKWGNTALHESASGRIMELIQSASFDQISSLAAELRTKMIVSNVRVIEHMGKVIAKELIRNTLVLDARTRAQWNQIRRSWEIAWHGTQYSNMRSQYWRGAFSPLVQMVLRQQKVMLNSAQSCSVSRTGQLQFLSPRASFTHHMNVIRKESFQKANCGVS